MLLQHIHSFLSGQGYSSSEDELHDIRPYQAGDPKSDINRKKTAKYKMLMTNVYEPDIHIHGHIIQVASWNWERGNTTSYKTQVQKLIKQLQNSIQQDTQSSITTTIVNEPPSKSSYTLHKTIVISDFLRSDEDINTFLHTCHIWHTRGIVLPLLTPTWVFHHPLLLQYPTFFWELDNQ